MESRRRTDDTATTELETPIRAVDPPAFDGHARIPWHDRPPVLIMASIAGVVALAALAFSVVSVSEQATHPVSRPATAASMPATAPRESTSSPTTTSEEPPAVTVDPPSVPDFAAGPTAEMKVPPPPPPPPDVLPPWLRRLFPNWNAGSG